MNRLEKIKTLYKTKTLKEIGKRFKISPQRVHQILNPLPRNFCEVHKNIYGLYCINCVLDKDYTTEFLQTNILSEVTRLSKKDRTSQSVLERKKLITHLRDVNKLSFSTIGKLLHRNHSSVINLYRQ